MRYEITRHGVVYELRDGDQVFAGSIVLRGAKGKAAFREYHLAELRETVAPGARVFVSQRRVSVSGMSRLLRIYVLQGDDLLSVTYSVSAVLDWRWADGDLRVTGCGMDMHWHTVDCLSRALFGEGDKLRCTTI